MAEDYPVRHHCIDRFGNDHRRDELHVGDSKLVCELGAREIRGNNMLLISLFCHPLRLYDVSCHGFSATLGMCAYYLNRVSLIYIEDKGTSTDDEEFMILLIGTLVLPKWLKNTPMYLTQKGFLNNL